MARNFELSHGKVILNFDLKAAAGDVTLTLHGRLGVQQARPLWDALSGAAFEGKTIRLEAGGVDEIDTSIAQILCRCGSRLQIGAASDGFMTALRIRGLEQYFVEQQAAPSEQPPAPAQRPREPAPAAKSRSRRGANPAQRAA